MKLAAVAALAALAAAPAFADQLYILGTSNDSATSGTGPFAQLDIALIDPTHALFTYTRLDSFVFGEMGGNLNATTFSVSPVSFTLAASSTQTPTYTLDIGGQLDGFGNFVIDETSVPNGFSAAVTEASFTVTDLSGTWATAAAVLVDNGSGNAAAVHAFTSTGGSFFAADSSSSCIGAGCPPPPPPPPPPNVVEPGTLALMGTGLLGLGLIRRKRV